MRIKIKNAKFKMISKSTVSKYPKKDLSERFLNFSVTSIPLIDKVETTFVGRHISNQLFRSITSSGANYEEACAAQSKADFIHKMQIVLKELRETKYWLTLIEKSELLSKDCSNFVWILNETSELSNIIAKSIITAKQV